MIRVLSSGVHLTYFEAVAAKKSEAKQESASILERDKRGEWGGEEEGGLGSVVT